MSEEEKPKRTVAVRKHHSPEVWAQVRRDYLGGATASACSAHYGVSVDALRRRASKEKWCKAHHALTQAPPPPLHPFPDAQAAVKTGDSVFASRWAEIAHAAQLPPASEWSTWLFQGGRGAGKTRAGAEWLAARADAAPGIFALVGPTQHDVREVMVDGPSGLRAWADEFCIWPRPSETLANPLGSLR